MRFVRRLTLLSLLLAGVASVTLAGIALGQQQPAMDYTLKLSPKDLTTIAQALGRMPYGDVVGILNEMQRQITEQQQAAKPPSAGTPDPASPAPAK